MIPFLDLQAQYRPLKDEMAKAINRVLDTSSYILGPSVDEFEKAFAEYLGVQHCVAMNSGTAGLALLMQAHGIGEGDEVITVTNSFFASVEAIVEIGATPVVIDCEEATALMDPKLLEAAITPKTKAILPVHLYGQVCDMDAILKIARAHNVLVFEDACQAHGARLNGKRAGSMADGAAFSFYPGKNLGAYGDAGAAVTNDSTIAEKMRMLREHGSPKKYQHDVIGWNERMDGIQGGVLKVKLPHLDGWNARRRQIAELYRSVLPAGAKVFTEIPGGEGVYHLFVVRVPKREQVQALLKERGVQTLIHYPVPIHQQPAYKAEWQRGAHPVSEKIASEILSLPMFAELTDADVRTVAQTLDEVLKEKH